MCAWVAHLQANLGAISWWQEVVWSCEVAVNQRVVQGVEPLHLNLPGGFGSSTTHLGTEVER